MFEGKK